MPLNRVEPNWQAHSSFPYPVAGPGTDSGAAPTICLPINTSWIPYVQAALQQLAQPAAWSTASPLGVLGTMDQAEELINALATAGACGCTWQEQVWISSYNNNQVARLSTTGHAIGYPLVPPGVSQLRSMLQVGSNFWALTSNQLGIDFSDINGILGGTYTGHSFQYGSCLTSIPEVWVCTFSSAGVDVYSTAGVYSTSITHSGMSEPIYCAVDANGRVWVTNYSDSPGILVFNANHTFFNSVSPPGSYACYGVAPVVRSGVNYMWVTDVDQNRIYEYTLGLVLNATYAPSGLGAPTGVRSVGSDVWVVNTSNSLLILSPAGAVINTLAIYGANLPVDIQHVPAGP